MGETSERLEAIRARYLAAKPGTWEVFDDCGLMTVRTPTGSIAIDYDLPDAEFVAAAHEDIPWLIRYIAGLQAAHYASSADYRREIARLETQLAGRSTHD